MTPVVLAALAALASLAGAGCEPNASYATFPEPIVRLDLVGPSLVGEAQDEVTVALQAQVDLPCTTGVATKRNATGKAVHAEGCGRALTYVAISLAGKSDKAPGAHGQRVWAHLRRFVPVSREGADAAVAALERAAVSIAVEVGLANVVRHDADEWASLYEAAARDLPCPRESLAVDIVNNSRAPNTYLAEGCGFRGLFVEDSARKLVITSRVALAPPAR